MDVSNMPKIVPMEEREWFVLFAIAVAGKSAKQTEKKLNEYIGDNLAGLSPFEIVKCDLRFPGGLDYWLRYHRFGQYKRILRAWSEVVKLDVTKDLTVETARFIVLYTNPNADCVPLDTHILKFLKEKYPHIKVPKSSPALGHKYIMLEQLFKEQANALGKTVRQLDTEVWQYYARK